MPRSVLEAIKQGNLSYEPPLTETPVVPATAAMPGTKEKLGILAERLQQGLPLWHPSDRRTFNDTDED